MSRKSDSGFNFPFPEEKGSGRRTVRVADNIMKEIALLLLNKIKDPRVRNVTITQVDVSPDLRHAKVFYTCGDDAADEVAKGLKSAKGFMKKHLARVLEMRYTPDLDFSYDKSIKYQQDMERLLKEISDEHD